MEAIKAVSLTKRYKTKTAVDNISFEVHKGELFALLGVNGAGKTTTIRMLTCLSEPSEGEAFICGHSTETESSAVKNLIGISPQETSVADNLTVLENLEFMAKVNGFNKVKAKAKCGEMVRLFGMEGVTNSRAKTLSGGWKRKLSIAMALISEPQVLFLDEPTLGLDVLARRDLHKTIASLKGRITIVLTTHYMEEAEDLSDRIAVMVDGKIKALGTLSELEALSGQKGLEAAFVAIAERDGE